MSEDLKVIIREYLKENLSIGLNSNTEYDYGRQYDIITVKLYLSDECISSETVSLSSINSD